VKPPGRPFDADDDGVVYHPVHRCRGDHRVPEVVAELGEVDICGQDCRALAVAAVDNLVEEVGMSRLVLFQPVEAQFVDQEGSEGSERHFGQIKNPIILVWVKPGGADIGDSRVGRTAV
jgi:hypothetical protein